MDIWRKTPKFKVGDSFRIWDDNSESYDVYGPIIKIDENNYDGFTYIFENNYGMSESEVIYAELIKNK